MRDQESGVRGQESGAGSQQLAPLVVRVPPGVRSKEKLLGILAKGLRFPRYFGWNWDALEELLNDLSWLQPGRPVVIEHVDLPFGAGGENRAIYLDILQKAAASQPDRLRVALPADPVR